MSTAEAETAATLNVVELLSGGCTTLVEVGASALLVEQLAAQVEHALGSPSEVRARTLADGVSPLEAVDELIYPGVSIFVSRRSALVTIGQ
jgi:hypothetical protein